MPWPARVLSVFQVIENLPEIIIQLLDHRAIEGVGLTGLVPLFLMLLSDRHAEFLLILT